MAEKVLLRILRGITTQNYRTIFAALGKGEAKVDSRSASAVEAGQQQKLWPKESFLRRNFFPPPCRKETRMSPFFENPPSHTRN